jgi:hypothetical protein
MVKMDSPERENPDEAVPFNLNPALNEMNLQSLGSISNASQAVLFITQGDLLFHDEQPDEALLQYVKARSFFDHDITRGRMAKAYAEMSDFAKDKVERAELLQQAYSFAMSVSRKDQYLISTITHALKELGQRPIQSDVPFLGGQWSVSSIEEWLDKVQMEE